MENHEYDFDVPNNYFENTVEEVKFHIPTTGDYIANSILADPLYQSNPTITSSNGSNLEMPSILVLHAWAIHDILTSPEHDQTQIKKILPKVNGHDQLDWKTNKYADWITTTPNVNGFYQPSLMHSSSMRRIRMITFNTFLDYFLSTKQPEKLNTEFSLEYVPDTYHFASDSSQPSQKRPYLSNLFNADRTLTNSKTVVDQEKYGLEGAGIYLITLNISPHILYAGIGSDGKTISPSKALTISPGEMGIIQLGIIESDINTPDLTQIFLSTQKHLVVTFRKGGTKTDSVPFFKVAGVDNVDDMLPLYYTGIIIERRDDKKKSFFYSNVNETMQELGIVKRAFEKWAPLAKWKNLKSNKSEIYVYPFFGFHNDSNPNDLRYTKEEEIERIYSHFGGDVYEKIRDIYRLLADPPVEKKGMPKKKKPEPIKKENSRGTKKEGTKPKKRRRSTKGEEKKTNKRKKKKENPVGVRYYDEMRIGDAKLRQEYLAAVAKNQADYGTALIEHGFQRYTADELSIFQFVSSEAAGKIINIRQRIRYKSANIQVKYPLITVNIHIIDDDTITFIDRKLATMSMGIQEQNMNPIPDTNKPLILPPDNNTCQNDDNDFEIVDANMSTQYNNITEDKQKFILTFYKRHPLNNKTIR